MLLGGNLMMLLVPHDQLAQVLICLPTTTWSQVNYNDFDQKQK